MKKPSPGLIAVAGLHVDAPLVEGVKPAPFQNEAVDFAGTFSKLMFVSFSVPANGMILPTATLPAARVLVTLAEILQATCPINVFVNGLFELTKKPKPGGIATLGLHVDAPLVEGVKPAPFQNEAVDLAGTPGRTLLRSFVPLSIGLEMKTWEAGNVLLT